MLEAQGAFTEHNKRNSVTGFAQCTSFYETTLQVAVNESHNVTFTILKQCCLR